MFDAALNREIAANYDYFQRMLASYLVTQRGRFALLRQAAVVDFFDSPGDADAVGARQFIDGLYSIQQVSDEPIELGLYANGVD